MSNNRYPEKKNNKKTYAFAGVVILILLIIAAALYLFRSCSEESPPDVPDETTTIGSTLVYDDGAIEGGWDEADTDKIIDSLNEKVEEGMINIVPLGLPRGYGQHRLSLPTARLPETS